MRVLFLVPGGLSAQLQTVPAAARLAEALSAQVQVACSPAAAPAWRLLPAVEKLIPFDFDAGPSLADWANLLGNVREPDFQACINLASGRQVDLMLSMSHIPNRVAAGGFSATSTVTPPAGVWPAQTLAAYLQPLGIDLDADAFRLSLPAAALDQAAAALPAGQGPALLLAPGGGADDWPAQRWSELAELVRGRLADVRLVPARGGANLIERAAQLASCDVVLSSDPVVSELALLNGSPLVALDRGATHLPARPGVQGLGGAGGMAGISTAAVLTALGLA